jgi:hypothetical protein
VRTAPPAAWIRRPVAAIRFTAFASSPESVGYATFDGTTVVSTRTRVQRSSFASAAFASSASFNPSTRHRAAPGGELHQRGRMRHWLVDPDPAELPPGDGIRHLPAQRLEPEAVTELEDINRRYVSIGVDGRPIRGSKYGTKGVKKTGSSNKASTRANCSGSRRSSSGRIASHNVG